MKESMLQFALRTLCLLVLVLVTLDSKWTTVDSCGVTIHNEIAFRASRILLAQLDHSFTTSCSCPHAHLGRHSTSCSQLHSATHSQWNEEQTDRNQSKALYNFLPLLTHRELLFAGSFFPDWGYNCIGKLWNNAAEQAHWPPFIEESVKYILETYPQPWTDHTKDLITFLFGVVSHSMGDLSWHALKGLNAGFIGALAQTSFAGDHSKGHTLADIGAEFVLSHMSKMNHLITRWKVPVKDITEIYKRMGHHVPGLVLRHCMRTGFALAQANAILGSRLFPVYASKSPFLVQQLINYPMGGLRDMAEWTVDCWKGFAEYLDQKRKLHDDEDRKANKTFNMCYALWEGRTKQDQESMMKLTHERQIRHQREHRSASRDPSVFSRLSLAGMQVQSKVDEDTGMVTFSIEETEKTKHVEAEKVEDMTAFILLEDPEERVAHDSWRQPQEIPFDETFDSAVQHRFTWRNRAFNPLDRRQRARPRSSSVGSNACLSFKDEQEAQTRTLFLPMEYASFGHAVTTGDFDGDGNIDVVVAAPHLTLDPMTPSQGAVFIVPNKTLLNAQSAEQSSRRGEPGTDVRSIASRVLYGDPDEPQSRFGWSLAVVDLNRDGIDDLAIGAPGRGAKDLKYDGSVFVYFGHKDSGLSQEPDLVIYHDRGKNEELGTPEGMDTLAGLGYKLKGVDLTGSGFKDLLIGMPMVTTRIATENQESSFKSQAGKILVFLSQTMHIGHKLDSNHDWQLEGEDAFGWFGASFTVISPGSYESTVSSGISTLSSIVSWFKPMLPKRDSQAMQNSLQRKILVVGSPSFGLGEQDAMRGKIEGFVVPDFPQQSLRGTVSSLLVPQKVFTIHGDNKFGQLGSSLALHRITPSSAYFQSEAPVELLVIGSRSENIPRHLPRIGRRWQAGVVRILDISRLSEGADVKISDLDAIPDIVRDSLRGSQSMAHLSAAMEVSTDGKTLWLTEPYAKSEAGRVLEWKPDFEGRRNSEIHKSGDQKGTRRMNINDGVRGRQINPGLYYDGDGGGDGDDDGNHYGVKRCFFGADYRGRFGSHLLVKDLNGDGLDDIVVTSSHASQYATMAGIVTIKFRV